MDQSTILWIAEIVLAFVFIDVLLVEVRRCVREGKRILRRIAAYGDLPIVSLAATAPGDVQRIAAAFEQFPPLLVRAEAALVALKLLRKPAGG
jgi:hypothetical protein